MNDPKRLERLLELRKHEEEKRALQLVMAQQAAIDAQSALDELEAQRKRVEESIERLSGESVGRMKTLRLLLEQLDNGIRNARTVHALASATASEKVEALAKASREREALERVIEPRREQIEAVQRVMDQKAEDELAIDRFRRGRGSDR